MSRRGYGRAYPSARWKLLQDFLDLADLLVGEALSPLGRFLGCNPHGSEARAMTVVLFEEHIDVITPLEPDLFGDRANRGCGVRAEVLMGHEDPLGMPLECLRDDMREKADMPRDAGDLSRHRARRRNTERLDEPRQEDRAGGQVEERNLELSPARNHVERIALHGDDLGLVAGHQPLETERRVNGLDDDVLGTPGPTGRDGGDGPDKRVAHRSR